MTISTADILALSLIPGIGSKSLLKVASSGLSLRDIQDLDESALGAFIKGSRKKAAIEGLKERFEKFREQAEEQLTLFQQNGITLVTYWEDLYPAGYRALDDAPVFLYAKGNTALLCHAHSVAVIGTRECSPIGAKIAFQTASFFATNGFNIVSGLATGIDTAAHEGALSGGGLTTAILVDIEKIFPAENKKLAEQILASGGLLLAENPPGSFMNRGMFVQRDRLQSALSSAVFAIETDIQGGTMHTVRFAQEQKKLLFCPDLDRVPSYPREYPKSNGIRKLLAEGKARAYTAADYAEILAMLKRTSAPPNEKNGGQGELFL